MGLLVLGSLALARPAATRAQTGDVGYRDLSYNGSGVSAPSGEKPQSKLWFADGIWWGTLFNAAVDEYHIYRFDWGSQTWRDTGTIVDERNGAKADTLWDGSHLYVATGVFIGIHSTDPTTSADAVRILRYSYDPAADRYTLDAGFPVTITAYGTETVVLAKDTTGTLWVTFAHGDQGATTAQVYVTHSVGGDDTKWATPYVLPVQGTTVDPDDISSVVAFSSQIGVMWSNQLNAATSSAMYFAVHRDGDPDTAWVGSPVVQGPYRADDHISLAADASGEVFAAVKTSNDDAPNAKPDDPLSQLLVRSPTGTWDAYTFGTVADDYTRPIVVIDDEHRQLYLFAAPTGGGAIYYKQTSLDNISFPPGPGTPWIQNSLAPNINDPTSLKGNVSSATGVLVLASDDTTGTYLHNTLWLDPARPTPTALPTVMPTATPAPSDYASAVLSTAGLASYWRLGEKAGTVVNDSKGAINGRAVNGPTTSVQGLLAGVPDTAYAFDGVDDYVDFGPSYGFGGVQAFSVEFWMRASAVPLNGYTKLLWKEDTASAGGRTGWGTYLHDDGTTRSVALERYSGGTWLGGVSCGGVALNTVYHVVFTFDGSTARCYLNGSLAAGAAGGGRITASSRSLILGASDTTGDHFQGVLDEVAMYAAALPAAQVRQHYVDGTAGAPPAAPPLAAAPAASAGPAAAAPAVRLGNWRWYGDAASDASLVPLADQNTAPTLTGEQMQNGIVRLRAQLYGAGPAGSGAIQVQYSEDGTHWANIQNQAPDVDKEGIWFRWADGAAPAGAAVAQAALAGTTSLGLYHEAANVVEKVAAGATQEIDLAIRIHWPPPDDTVSFRLLYAGTPAASDAGSAPIQLRTSTAAARPHTITYIDDNPADPSTVNELGFGPWPRIFYDGTRWWLFVVQYNTPTELAYYSWAGPGSVWSAKSSVPFSVNGNNTRDAPAFKTINGTPVVLALFDPPTGSLKYRRGVFSGAAISWSGEFDLGAAPGGYAHVSSDDGNFWWAGGIDGTAGVWAARSTKPDAGTDWTPGFQPRKTLADPGVVAANGPGATSIPAVVGLGTDRALMVWSKSNSLRWATVSDASGFGPVGTVTSDSRLEDWGIVRAGKYVYLVQRTVRSNEFRLFVYDIAAGTWSAGTSPGVSGEVSGNDGIPLSAQRDDIYAFYTWDGAENVGKGEDRIVRYKKYTGPGAAGKWSAPTDLTVGGRLNGDHITTPSATAGEPMVIGWIVDDDDVQGTGQAIEYYAGLEAASRAVGQGVVRRTNAPGAPPPNMPLMAVAIAFSAATATATVIATRTSKPTVRPKR